MRFERCASARHAFANSIFPQTEHLRDLTRIEALDHREQEYFTMDCVQRLECFLKFLGSGAKMHGLVGREGRRLRLSCKALFSSEIEQ